MCKQNSVLQVMESWVGPGNEAIYNHLTVKNITTTSHINNVTLCSG